jgi:type VI secretion system protein ImpJ
MSWFNKVVWSEGLFLRPQLLQQQERYLEAYAHRRVTPLSPFFWGFERYEIDYDSLALGKLVLSRAYGVFADGTPFDAPSQTPPPIPLTIRPEHLEQVICLAVPILRPNTEETTFNDDPTSLARFNAVEEEVRDANAVSIGPKLIQIGQLRLRLLPEKELTDAWIGLPVAKVTALHSDGGVTIDSRLIPPVSHYAASTLLEDWVSKIHGLLQLRAQALAARLTGAEGTASGTVEVSDFLLLQMMNRYEPLLTHLLNVRESHPEGIYQLFSSFAGELATHVRTQTRRPKGWPPYQHLDPYHSFKELVDDLHAMLNEVLIRSAQRIDLEERPYGIRLAVVDPPTLQTFKSMVLAVSANIPTDALAHQFVAQSKFGPADVLPSLIRSHLPGIGISVMPVPPRQIPFNSGFVYFEINRNGQYWEHVLKNGGLAMHISTEFPGLQMELWGIRNK